MAGEEKAMRIDLNSNLLPPDGTQSVRTGSRSEGPAATGTSVADSAESSTQSLSAAALTAAVGQVPEVRQEKVAALAEQLRSGTYEVSAGRTAEAMVAQMRTA